MKNKVISLGFLLTCLLSSGCTSVRDFDTKLGSIVRPYQFSILGWEYRTVVNELKQGDSNRHKDIDNEVQIVGEYFANVEQIQGLKTALETMGKTDGRASLETELDRLQERMTALGDIVERIMARQITEVLTKQGIFNPFDRYIRWGGIFPPLNFRLEKPPHLLVISPRSRIESIREILLEQDLSVEEMEAIESEADELGVSSLVVTPGGLGATYPTFVTNDSDLRFTFDTAIEEWVHQYLVFRPLGFKHLLDLIGLARNYEIHTMDETVASMVSKEVGDIVCQTYYPQLGPREKEEAVEPNFDFNREMRDIRRTVDQLLARGEIDQAEKFMEERRQYLASQGYYIRKLNQAYFAFHGTYADSPTSIDPIGVELKTLRDKSASLKDFLDTVAGMTSRQDLIQSIK